MTAEKTKDPAGHPVLGRYHGFSATGITLKEFTKIIQSLHPVGSQKAAASATSATPVAEQTSVMSIHPKVFSMIDSWVSDSESPVVTEINVDAVEKYRNEFNEE